MSQGCPGNKKNLGLRGISPWSSTQTVDIKVQDIVDTHSIQPLYKPSKSYKPY